MSGWEFLCFCRRSHVSLHISAGSKYALEANDRLNTRVVRSYPATGSTLKFAQFFAFFLAVPDVRVTGGPNYTSTTLEVARTHR